MLTFGGGLLPEIDLFARQTSFLLSTDAISETEQFPIPDR